VNDASLTETADCWARFKVLDVVQGVTEEGDRGNPEREKVTVVLLLLLLIATIAKPPLEVWLNAVTNTPVTGFAVAPIRTHPVRTNFDQLPTTYIRALVIRPLGVSPPPVETVNPLLKGAPAQPPSVAPPHQSTSSQ
jgi:hypothetical protein